MVPEAHWNDLQGQKNTMRGRERESIYATEKENMNNVSLVEYTDK